MADRARQEQMQGVQRIKLLELYHNPVGSDGGKAVHAKHILASLGRGEAEVHTAECGKIVSKSNTSMLCEASLKKIFQTIFK